MKLSSLSLTPAVVLLFVWQASAEATYTNDFQKAEVGKVPEDLMVLDGQFTVQEEGGNKFLELPGAPTDTYSVMFGPSTNATGGVAARIYATAKGRRMPAFAVALNGIGGYKLQVSPAKKAVELFKGDTLVQSVPCAWKSGEWTLLQLTAQPIGGSVKLSGKVTQPGNEPIEISHSDDGQINAGKASISGTPFSGTPIRFDDLSAFQTK